MRKTRPRMLKHFVLSYRMSVKIDTHQLLTWVMGTKPPGSVILSSNYLENNKTVQGRWHFFDKSQEEKCLHSIFSGGNDLLNNLPGGFGQPPWSPCPGSSPSQDPPQSEAAGFLILNLKNKPMKVGFASLMLCLPISLCLQGGPPRLSLTRAWVSAQQTLYFGKRSRNSTVPLL